MLENSGLQSQKLIELTFKSFFNSPWIQQSLMYSESTLHNLSKVFGVL